MEFDSSLLALTSGLAVIPILLFGILDAGFSIAKFLDGLRTLREEQALLEEDYNFLEGLIEGYDNQGASVPEPVSSVLELCGIMLLYLFWRRRIIIDLN